MRPSLTFSIPGSDANIKLPVGMVRREIQQLAFFKGRLLFLSQMKHPLANIYKLTPEGF